MFDSEEETRRRVSNIPQAVADALERLQRFGIPFLRNVVTARERTKNFNAT